MKNLWFLIGIVAISISPARACDVCGGASGGNYFGILPQFHRHFIGLRYQYRSFYTRHPALSPLQVDSESSEHTNNVEIWGRYSVNRRMQVFAFLPFTHLEREQHNAVTSYVGVGDASVIVNYTLFNTGDSLGKKWQHALQIGGGLKLPTGQRNFMTPEGEFIETLQPGSGSIDIPINAIYTLRNQSVGLNTEVNYRFNTANKDGYKFGDRLTSSIRAFWWKQAGQVILLPSAGINHEWTDVNTQNGYVEDMTGGQVLLATAGLDLYYKRFSLSVHALQPLYQLIGDDNIKTYTRVSANVSYLF